VKEQGEAIQPHMGVGVMMCHICLSAQSERGNPSHRDHLPMRLISLLYSWSRSKIAIYIYIYIYCTVLCCASNLLRVRRWGREATAKRVAVPEMAKCAFASEHRMTAKAQNKARRGNRLGRIKIIMKGKIRRGTGNVLKVPRN
jgi:hypothetical protein